MAQIQIVRLKPEDWQRVRDLRIEALKNEPFAFGSYPDDAREHDEKIWRERLQNPWYFFAEKEGKLVGTVCAIREVPSKVRHTAKVVGVYVSPEVRGQKVGRRLMETLLDELHKDESIIKVQLNVTAPQTVAKNMYENLGFKQVGLLEKEVCVDGEYFDTHMMQLFLKQV